MDREIPPEVFDRVLPFFTKIMQAPFPSPPVITDMVSREFPEMEQHEVFRFVQLIKASIAGMEHIYKAATPYLSAPAIASCLGLARTLQKQANVKSHN